jgi:alpha-L-fucosidase
MEDYIDKIAVVQVRELLSNYGEFPNILWWDTPVKMNRERAEKLLPLLALKPDIITNERLGGGIRGDIVTPERGIPSNPPAGDFEVCMTMNNTWGYRSDDHNWKSTKVLVRNLIDIASKGGNYLLNVGPRGDGAFPPPAVKRLESIGRWMNINGDAIHGTTASPLGSMPWGRITKKHTADGVNMYLHVFDWPSDEKLLVRGLRHTIDQAVLVATDAQLATEKTPEGIMISLPSEMPDPISSTILIRVSGGPDSMPLAH